MKTFQLTHTSDFTGEQIEAAKLAVIDAQNYLIEREDAYQRAISSAGRRWADKNKLPLVNQAKDRLDLAQKTLNMMLQVVNDEQGIALVDTSMYEYNNQQQDEQPESFPMATAMMAAGAILLVFVIYKLL